ncbi:hypothetical protein BHE74_00004189 [Ensete ventricosum]|nr:hypothetical protein GW17_00049721 [Ensete ventricosum]RWW87015.1 hypothetical protein BHE74_00004189 [Ensete ventricosum]
MDRNRKREAADERSQEKRACSLSEFRPCSSTSSSQPPPHPQTDSEMESSSSGRSDRAGDSGYGSCDSDDFAGGYDSRNLVGRGRLQRVFSGLLLDDGSGGSAQLAALTELCEVLSFCMEDAVGYFPLETVVPPLVKLASHESNPDVMLLAIRAVTYLCDAMPRSAEAIVRHGALPVLCGKLLAIEYLDVAEQGLIDLLRKLATSSLVAVQTLFEHNISRTLMGILMGSDMLRDSAYVSVQDMQTNQVSRQEEQCLPAVDSSPKQTMSAKEVTEGTSSASPSIGSAKPKLTFSLRGKQLDSSRTLYQAVLEEQIAAEFDMVVGSKFWSEVYKLTYKSVEEPKANDSEMLNCVPQSSVFWNKHGFSDWKYPFLLAELPCKIDKLNASYDVLFMLKILEGMNHYSFQLLTDERLDAFAEGLIENFDDLKAIVSSVPQVEFVNSKLNDKLEQQMQDPLVLATGCMPSWCGQLMAACPFLFSFEARWKYFYLTTFGSLSQQNNIQHLDGSGTNSLSDRHPYSGSLRKKFIVNRNNILESAVKMMELHAQSKGTLEVEYTEEVGTGLGPTMEFFTLVSHEFQKVGLDMWRGDLSYAGIRTIDGCSEFVLAPFGLFPRPWSTPTDDSGVAGFPEVIKMFLLLGKLVAKAIRDGRILDIPFSRAFYKIILEQVLLKSYDCFV